MTITRSSISCGAYLVYDLRSTSPKTQTRKIAAEVAETYRRAAFYIFSDHAENSPGSRLADFLKEINCGKVIATESRVNPNSGNKIRVWMYTPSVAKLRAWLKDDNAATAAARKATKTAKIAI